MLRCVAHLVEAQASVAVSKGAGQVDRAFADRDPPRRAPQEETVGGGSAPGNQDEKQLEAADGTVFGNQVQVVADASGPTGKEGFIRNGDHVGLLCSTEKHVAFAVNQRTVLAVQVSDGARQTTRAVQVANLEGLRGMALFSGGIRSFLVAGYENGLIRVLPVVSKSDKSAMSESKVFVLRDSRCGVRSVIRLIGHTGAEQVWILYEDKVVIRVPFSQFVMRPSWSELEGAKVWALETQATVSGFGAFAHKGMQLSPDDMFVTEDTHGKSKDDGGSMAIIAVGDRPTWALYVTEEARRNRTGANGLKVNSIGTLATAAASALASSLGNSMLSFTRSWVTGSNEMSHSTISPSRLSGDEVDEDSGSEGETGQLDQDGQGLSRGQDTREGGRSGSNDTARAYASRVGTGSRKRSLKARHSVYDSPSRTMSETVNTFDPSGRYCVTTDSLGRVVLVDSAALRIVKVWKGYRDAKTAWISSPEKWSMQWGDQHEPSRNEKDDNVQERSCSVLSKVDGRHVTRWGQYLTIFAPWRQTMQIWRVPGCVLVASFGIKCTSPEHVHLSTYVDTTTGLAQCTVINLETRAGIQGKWAISRVELPLSSLERLLEHLNSKQAHDRQNGFSVHRFRRAQASNDVEKAVALVANSKDLASLWRLLHASDTVGRAAGNGYGSAAYRFQNELVRVARQVVHDIAAGDGDVASSNGDRGASAEDDALYASRVRDLHAASQKAFFEAFLQSRKKLMDMHKDLSLSENAKENLADIAQAGGTLRFGCPFPNDMLNELGFDELPAFLVSVNNKSPSQPLTLVDFLRSFGCGVETPLIPAIASRGEDAPVIKKGCTGLSPERKMALAELLFAPLMADIFLFSKVETTLDMLGISNEEQQVLLLDWWFRADPALLTSVLSKRSNGISRFLERFFYNAPLSSESGPSDGDQASLPANQARKGSPPFIEQVQMLSEKSYLLVHSLALVNTARSALKSFSKKSKHGGAGQISSNEESLLLLEARLGAALLLAARTAPVSEGRLTVEALGIDGNFPLCKLVGEAQAVGANIIPGEHLAEISVNFPGQFKASIWPDAVASHCVLSLARDGKLASALSNARSVESSFIRSGLLLTIWKEHVLPQIARSVLDVDAQALRRAHSEYKHDPHAKHEKDLGPVSLCELGLAVLSALSSASADAERILAAQGALHEKGDPISKAGPPEPIDACDAQDACDNWWPPIRPELSRQLATICLTKSPGKPSQKGILREQQALLSAKALALLALAGDPGIGGRLALHKVVQQLFLPGSAPVLSISKSGISGLSSEPKEDRASDDGRLETRRLLLVGKLLALGPGASFAEAERLAKLFGLFEDRVKIEQTTLLYTWGLDSRAEQILEQVKDTEQVATILLAVARKRMADILNEMQKNPKYRHLLAVVSADTSRWIRAAAEPNTNGNVAATDRSGEAKSHIAASSAPSSLSSTLILLRRVQERLPADNDIQNRAVQMTRAADALFRRLQEMTR